MQGVPMMMLSANASQCTAGSNTSRSSLSNRSSPSEINGTAAVQSTLISRAGRAVISTFSPMTTTTMNADIWSLPDATNPFRPHKHRIISSSNTTTPLSQSQIAGFPSAELCFQQQLSQKTLPSQQFDQERAGNNEEALQTKQQQQQYFQGTYHHHHHHQDNHLGQIRFQDGSAASTANSSLCNPSPEQLNFRKKIKRTIDCSSINQQQLQQQQTSNVAHPFKFQRSQSTRSGNILQKSRNQASQININNTNNLNNSPPQQQQQQQNATTNIPSRVDCIPLAITGEQIHMSNNHHNHNHGRYGFPGQINNKSTVVLPLRSNKYHYRRHHRYGNQNIKYSHNDMKNNQGEGDYQLEEEENQGNEEIIKNKQNKHNNHQAFWKGNSSPSCNGNQQNNFNKKTQEETKQEEDEEEEEKSCQDNNNKQSFSQSAVVVGTGIACKAGLFNSSRKPSDLFSHRNNRRHRYQQQVNKGNVLGKQEQFNQQQQQQQLQNNDLQAGVGNINTNQKDLSYDSSHHGLGQKPLKRPSYNARRDTQVRLLNQQKEGVEGGAIIGEQEISDRMDQNIDQRRDFEEQQLKIYGRNFGNDGNHTNNNDAMSQSELVSSSQLDQEDESQLMQMLRECSDYEKDNNNDNREEEVEQQQQYEQYYSFSQEDQCECNSQGNSYAVNNCDDVEIQGDIEDMFREIEGVYADLQVAQGRNIRQSDDDEDEDDGSGMQSDGDADSCSNEVTFQYDYKPAGSYSKYGANEGEEEEEYYGDNNRLSLCNNCQNQEEEEEEEEGNEDLEGQSQNNDDDDYNMNEQQYSLMMSDVQGQYEGLSLLRHDKNDSDDKQQDDNEEGLHNSKLNSSSQHSESYHNTSASHEDDDDDLPYPDSENSRLQRQQLQSQWSEDNQFSFNNHSEQEQEEEHLSHQDNDDDDNQANLNEGEDEDSRLYYDLYPRVQSQQLPLRSYSSAISGQRSQFQYDNYEGTDDDDHDHDDNDNDNDDSNENQELEELAMPEMSLSLYNQHAEIDIDYDNNNNNLDDNNHSEEEGEGGRESMNNDDEEEHINNYSYQIEVDDPFSNFFHSITIGSFVRSQLNHLLSDMQMDELDMHEFVGVETESQQFYFGEPMEEDEEMIMPEYYEEEQIPLMLTDEQIQNMKTTFYHANHPHKTCAICLSDFNLQEHLRELPCTHHFHVDCVDDWLRIKPSCPLCRQNFLELEEVQQQEEEEDEQEEEEEFEQEEEEEELEQLY